MDEPVEVLWARGYDAADLLAELVAERTGTHPGPLHHLCPTCGALTHGRPSYDAPVEVSIARAGELVVVALSLGGPIGVDVALSSPDARDWARNWVRAEALAKAHGTGIVVDHDSAAADVWVQDVAVQNGYLSAVAGFRNGLSPQPEARVTRRRRATG